MIDREALHKPVSEGRYPDITGRKLLFREVLEGRLSDSAIVGLLGMLADHGESAVDIAGAVLAMREAMIPVRGPKDAIDVCGTGGDGSNSLNVSTAVALVTAACGVPVAKHGNRAASSKAGGADTLQALGLDLDKASDLAEQTLNEVGIAFLFAQKHHPALARLAHARKVMGRRTIFNIVGPMCNPASVRRQLIGVANPSILETVADVMNMIETMSDQSNPGKIMIVSGGNDTEGYIDEIATFGSTKIASIGLPEWIGDYVTPDMAGLPAHPLSAIKGGNAEFNAAALHRLLMGEQGAYRDAVLLNAAGALIVAGEVNSWRDGVEEAAEALDKGLAKALLDCWIDTVS